ncbi:trehalose operon repressor [Paenibacillus sp. P96]|uniref:Trehalose operon repressor n=1 Tax=Paenibacillus zeirhizosphaerae TaxID=2987519 RepID=A0ABT9FWD5_9BACL|nr:trehalose operon repressor [Paenibacillus sp. P96]MDP4099036.1 trehalose operon repressor [Paenibacillus sp. P96]
MNRNIYLQIFNDYSEQIQAGRLAPGTKLPSEHDITAEYDTSRETVRKALNLLAQNGYIHKVKGKGSFVLDIGRMKFSVTGLISFKEMSEIIGSSTKTHVYEVKLIPASSELARQLQIAAGEPVWKVVRSREIKGERIILDKDFFLSSVVESLDKEIASHSIYEYLERDLQLKISYAKKEISVEEVTEEDRRLLDLHDYRHIVVVRNYVYLEDTTQFQYTESRHRLDKFQFVDFARRVHGEDPNQN